jgi:hypothetical protein
MSVEVIAQNFVYIPRIRGSVKLDNMDCDRNSGNQFVLPFNERKAEIGPLA